MLRNVKIEKTTFNAPYPGRFLLRGLLLKSAIILIKNLNNYSKLYPEMGIELQVFFSGYDGKAANPKTVMDFCLHYKASYRTTDLPQPSVVNRMCEILCENGLMSSIDKRGVDGMASSYLCFPNKAIFSNPESRVFHSKRANYMIYGFPYIYEELKKYVRPLEHTKPNGDKTIGTSFLFRGGVVTAKHCIEGASKISIKGIAADELKRASFKVHENPYVDLVFIKTDQRLDDTLSSFKEANVLDEIMALGYPKIPGFHSFLTTETATVSSRYTPSVGQIASKEEDLWAKDQLLLVTARIRGGNSGGPIIERNGAIVGIATDLTDGADGDYDNLGYGVVIPISLANEIIDSDKKNTLNTSKMDFVDFLQNA